MMALGLLLLLISRWMAFPPKVFSGSQQLTLAALG